MDVEAIENSCALTTLLLLWDGRGHIDRDGHTEAILRAALLADMVIDGVLDRDTRAQFGHDLDGLVEAARRVMEWKRLAPEASLETLLGKGPRVQWSLADDLARLGVFRVVVTLAGARRRFPAVSQDSARLPERMRRDLLTEAGDPVPESPKAAARVALAQISGGLNFLPEHPSEQVVQHCGDAADLLRLTDRFMTESREQYAKAASARWARSGPGA